MTGPIGRTRRPSLPAEPNVDRGDPEPAHRPPAPAPVAVPGLVRPSFGIIRRNEESAPLLAAMAVPKVLSLAGPEVKLQDRIVQRLESMITDKSRARNKKVARNDEWYSRKLDGNPDARQRQAIDIEMEERHGRLPVNIDVPVMYRNHSGVWGR